MAVRTNLCTNPSFEVNNTGWTAYSSGQINRTTTTAYAGSASASLPNLTTTSALVSYGFDPAANSGTSSAWPVTPGDTWTISYYAKAISSTGTVGIRDIWLNSSNTFLSDDGNGTLVSVSTTGWTRITRTSTVPSSAAKMSFAVVGGTGIYIDAVLIEKASGAGTYFDGSTVNSGHTYAWTGTANSSTSTDTGPSFASDLSGSGTLTSSLTKIRTNIFKTPSLEATLPGGLNIGQSTSTTTGVVAGFKSLQITANGTNDSFASTEGGPSIYPGFTSGKTYTLSGYITLTAPLGGTLHARSRKIVLFHNNGTTYTEFATTQAPNAAGTYRVSTTFTIPSGTTEIFIRFYNGAPSGGGNVWWDAVLIEEGSTLGGYFDGNSSAAGKTYAWNGTADNSTSTETAALGTGNSFTSALSGSGTLGSSLAYTKRASVALSGSGALTAALHRSITSQLSGSGSLTSILSGWHFNSSLSGSGTLTSSLHRYIISGLSGSGSLSSQLLAFQHIASSLSGSGSLASVLSGFASINSVLFSEGNLSSVLVIGNQITSRFYGYGALVSTLHYSPRFTSVLGGGEGVLYSELAYVLQPQPLAELPLGKLIRYTVNNYAVPLNPAEGSGSTPSVNATYVKGKNPEFALGEDFTVDNAAVGRYTGEIVRLSLNKKSDVATISTDTALTKANVEMHLYPFIDADPGLWTAARAIDYWTQQCGVLFDNVDGEVSVYASGYGHANGFALGISDSHFYDKVTAGSVSTTVLNGRTVTSFGYAATTVMAQHEAPQTRVPVNVSANRRMVFSLGVAVRGTGRTASVTYNFIDGSEHTHSVVLTATSDGTITATVNGSVTHTLAAPGTGTYRVSFSIQRVSATAMVGKLTIHSDDLDGTGTLLLNSPSKAFPSILPGTLWLTSVDHASTGGSGAEMLRWGTYLSVAKYHPMTLPAVQKNLQQSKKPLAFVSGFSGNVWKLLNEFCSINRLDVSFLGDRIVLGPRANGFSGSVKFSDFTVDSERREKYKQVAVVNKRSKAVTTGDAVFWRADSVFQVAAREVFETTVQTGHSILNLSQPVAASGIEPFPYKQGTGQYVVTGADGYIVSPAWWNDNGGKVEVKMTEKEGEIAIKITAPTLDTVRAPYRISEGAGDRPALYISGSGIVNDPTELHISTGAKNAREGFDNVFESPFIATTADAYNTAVRMALLYSAAMADATFNVSNGFGVPSDLGTFPAGAVFTDNERNYKITNAAQTHSQTSGNAIPFTSIAAYNASFAAGATIRDEKARHAGRTIKQANIKPLRSNDE